MAESGNTSIANEAEERCHHALTVKRGRGFIDCPEFRRVPNAWQNLLERLDIVSESIQHEIVGEVASQSVVRLTRLEFSCGAAA